MAGRQGKEKHWEDEVKYNRIAPPKKNIMACLMLICVASGQLIKTKNNNKHFTSLSMYRKLLYNAGSIRSNTLT